MTLAFDWSRGRPLESSDDGIWIGFSEPRELKSIEMKVILFNHGQY